MNHKDDDILIREGCRSVSASKRHPNRLVVSSQEDDSSTATSPLRPALSPKVDSRCGRERVSSLRRHGGESKVYLAADQKSTKGFEKNRNRDGNGRGGGDEAAGSRTAHNAFAALATMLNFHEGDDAVVHSNVNYSNDDQKISYAGSGPSSPSSLSSVSESPERYPPRTPPAQQDYASKEQGLKSAAANSTTPADNAVRQDKDIRKRTDKSRARHHRPARSSPRVTNKTEPPPTLRKKATVSHSFRSIVGSRPTHWDRNDKARGDRGHKFSQPNSLKRQAALAAAVTDSFKRSKMEKVAASVQQQTPGQTKRSLIPSFLPSRRERNTTHDAIEDAIQNVGDWSGVNDMIPPTAATTGPSARVFGSSPYMSPPPSERKAPQKKGPIAKRLQSLRDETRGDILRLQSGQYPFSLHRSDPNDPRKRASTTCNITVLGTPIGTGKLLTALCYIHSWEVSSLKDGTASLPSANDPNGLVWAAFSIDTAGQTNLVVPGSQLRIYNAVVVPLTSSQVPLLILCTVLCESYPTRHLPALPPINLRVVVPKQVAETS